MRKYARQLLSVAFVMNWYTLAEFNRDLAAGKMPKQNLDGKEIRIPGYMTAYELVGATRETEEFLFVPSTLGCVHIPPPPKEMTLEVKMKKKVKASDDLIWLEGTAKILPSPLDPKKKALKIEGAAVRPVKDSEMDEAKGSLPLQNLPDCQGRDKNEPICAGQYK